MSFNFSSNDDFELSLTEYSYLVTFSYNITILYSFQISEFMFLSSCNNDYIREFQSIFKIKQVFQSKLSREANVVENTHSLSKPLSFNFI